jgi:DNA-binding MarR family transcriptional regulator
VTRLTFRGPFLLVFALGQQLGSLLSKAMADSPLKPAEFAVYSTLRLEQPTTPTVLARTLGMRATTMSSHLAKMAAADHLERVRNPGDGRSSLISLTPAGLAATEECFAGFQRAIGSFQGHLEIPQQQLLDALEAASRALDAALDSALDSSLDAELDPHGTELPEGAEWPGPPE